MSCSGLVRARLLWFHCRGLHFGLDTARVSGRLLMGAELRKASHGEFRLERVSGLCCDFAEYGYLNVPHEKEKSSPGMIMAAADADPGFKAGWEGRCSTQSCVEVKRV